MRIRGIDTLEFGINIQNYEAMFLDFLKELEVKRTMSQQNYKSEVLSINKCNFEVSAKGIGFYKYKIQNNEFIICFMNKTIGNTPHIYVKFLSAFLWEYGYKKAIQVFLEWFKIFNANILEIKVSRLDVCLDIDEIEFNEKDVNKFFTRARKREVNYMPDNVNFGSRFFTGLVIGKGSPLLCRIYNKTLEIKASNKKWFEGIWKEVCWNGENTVWRIEFQIRRKILKELKIDNIEDIEKELESIWAYLTQTWLVMKVKGKDTNKSRWKTDKRWIKVQKAEEDYFATPTVREKIKKGDLERMLNQVGGLILSITAQKENSNIENSLERIKKHMKDKESLGKINIEKEIEKRRHRFINENS